MQSIRMPFCVLFALGIIPSSRAFAVDYVKEIKPIFVEKCYSCHGAWKQKSHLRVETISLLKKGGSDGPAIVPGKPDDGTLLERLATEDSDRLMPPHGEGERLTKVQLAKVREWIQAGAPGPDEEAPADPHLHWAFQPPVKPTVPPGFANPIDAIVAAEHQKRGLTPAPEADPRTLLRRIHFDLTGLPPTPEQMQVFLNDRAPDAYDRVVDRLLASPQYAERWARHWMDIWRYSDWSGENNNQVRGSPKHIWRWRDWIVESLQADKGYDQMIREMLAGDEVAPQDPKTLRATGFLARNYYRYNRNVWMDDSVEHTVKAFLGLTIGCARCHDHKFDPLSMNDYYSLRAVFEPYQVGTDSVGGRANLDKDGLVRVYDRDFNTPTYLFKRGDETLADRSRPLKPHYPDIFGDTLAVRKIAVGPPSIALAAIASTRVMQRPDTSSGRRLALASRIVDRDNPLTARVAVNHIWLRHMGTPLVESVGDFGLRTAKPEWLRLLDYLAIEFRDSGWSMKKIHRRIVTSQLYRRQSESPRNPAVSQQKDPENRLYWRANSHRLEAEAVRDAVLAVAGVLDSTRGGPEIPLSEADRSLRRSLYFRHAHERQVKFLEAFDSANPLECYRRSSTVIPQQALALWNGPFVTDHARTLAGKLRAEEKVPAAQIHRAFEVILQREPTPTELARCSDFLRENPLENLCHVLFNHTEFVTIR